MVVEYVASGVNLPGFKSFLCFLVAMSFCKVIGTILPVRSLFDILVIMNLLALI